MSRQHPTLGGVLQLEGEISEDQFERVVQVTDELTWTFDLPPREMRDAGDLIAFVDFAGARHLIRAIGMDRAAVMLGQGDWCMRLGGDALVSGTNDGMPWIIVDRPVSAPLRALARVGMTTVVARDAFSAALALEALHIDAPNAVELLDRFGAVRLDY